MIRRIVQISVSILLLALLLSWVETDKLLERLASIRLDTAFAALLLLLVQNDLATRRWSTAFGVFQPRLRYLRMLLIQYMALFAQLFLPSSIGGAAVRAGMLVRSNVPVGVAVNSVVLDRVVAFVGLAALAVCFMPAATVSISVENSREILILLSATTVFLGIAIVLALRWKPLSEWAAVLKKTPLRTFIEPLERGAPSMVRPGFLVPAFLYSLGGQFAAIFAIFILAGGSGLTVGLLDCILILPPVMLVSALPISVAGWGVREGAMVVAFGLLGVSHEAALVLSLQYAVMGYLAALPGAIAWFLEVDRLSLGRAIQDTDIEQSR